MGPVCLDKFIRSIINLKKTPPPLLVGFKYKHITGCHFRATKLSLISHRFDHLYRLIIL